KPRCVLAVDDEPSDLENLRRVLTAAGYDVRTASNAKTAIEIFQAHADDIDVLVTDVAMSPISGPDLAGQLVRLKPDLYVTFVSAYSGSLAFRYSGVPISTFAFVAKPFSANDLLEKISPQTEQAGREKVLSSGGAAASSEA